MKVTTLILSAVAALGFSALQASASIGTTVNYSSLSCTIIVNAKQSQAYLGNGISYVTSAQTRIGNKQLLDLFAMWVGADRTTAPWNNARLVVGWDWDWDILVVDGTGTNVLFDTTEGVDSGSFNVDFFDEYGDGNWTEKDPESQPGYYTVNDTDAADWELYDDEGSIPYTDLWGDSSNTQSFRQQWDAHGNGTTWSDSEDAVFGWTGDQYWLDNGYRTSTKAEFTATGSGTGYNYVGWAD
jgi:hypothetical protein